MSFVSSRIFIFFLCIYEITNIGKETYKNNGIESIIDDIGTLWLNEKHIENCVISAIQLDYKENNQKRNHF